MHSTFNSLHGSTDRWISLAVLSHYHFKGRTPIVSISTALLSSCAVAHRSSLFRPLIGGRRSVESRVCIADRRPRSRAHDESRTPTSYLLAVCRELQQ